MAQQNSGIPTIEIYWSLVDKADKKFAKIRDLPLYERNRFDTYFCKVFKVYTELWKFQQANRQKLVDGGLKRWEIGEIASRIGQLYFGQYTRTSDASYLSESYVFYEALLTREYFKEGMFQDINLANKQLRFIARFITVCLVLNRRHMVHQLVNHLKILLDECKRAFKEANFREWKVVVQEVAKFLKADTNFMNIRPLRYSLVLDPHPDTLPHVSSYNPKRNLKLRDAVLSSYHPNEVKYSELTLDTYRMLQSLEWEPSGAFYHSGSGAGQDGTTKNSGSNHTQDITDPTLPRNPRKAVLYRPSVTHFIAILATACDELPADGVLFIYLSGKSGSIFSPSSGAGSRLGPESSVKILLQSQTALHATSMTDGHSPLCGQSEEALSNSPLDCIHIGCRGNEGSSYIYPSDLLPFTRRPLFIVIDSESSGSVKIISGSEKGESAAMLLSPKSSPSTSTGEWSRHLNGSLFTIFLTAPIQAFCLLLGSSGSDIQTDLYDTADKLLSSSLNDWGLTLATSGSLDPVWSQVFCDPFLRRLLLRFIFCRAVLALYAPSHEKGEFIPQCLPSLPEFVHPSSHAIQSTILQIANVFDARSSFIFSEDLIPQENSHISQE
ncbi:protein SCAI-like [Chenopodium quinoa]|uniref:protein SCAI-like n=1 Tax=Chenopodium quinoa TaxID=63459 RepID=UPI000B774DA8|nr:protein SCAI-like [Chenopodium quinoa]XP_021755151.1 protein SCAI-like [Chenopodium quinoa]